MAREYKTLSFKVNSVDEEQGIFEGYASVFGNVDSGGDIVEPGAFTECLENGIGRIKILALHNDAWLPIGVPLELKEDKTGLYIKGKVSDTSMGKDIKILLRDGVLNEMSIGYDPVDYDYDAEMIRHLRKVELWEVSLVTWAMNEQATVTGYKALQRGVEDIAAETERARKEGRRISGARLQTLEEASTIMRKAAKTLDSLIREARGESPKARPPAAATKYAQRQIEIIRR
ncbi:MAG: HK97 family phage prohead protease [Provencibacterium sp.]|jgi:HK97 family phage prohead protease|nr:HK97 family phage prohead protease [Provencibacterium sp.]